MNFAVVIFVLIAVCVTLISFKILIPTQNNTAAKPIEDFVEVEKFKRFHPVDTFPSLVELAKDMSMAKNEVDAFVKKNISNGGNWKMIPLVGFGINVKPTISEFPKTIASLRKHTPGFKTAIFSQMEPDSVFEPQSGWSSLSNHVIRCHLPLVDPFKSSSVGNESLLQSGVEVDGVFKKHIDGEWLLFDASLKHTIINEKSEHQIILIVDLPRDEADIEHGIADDEISEELNSFIETMRSLG